MMPLRLCPPQAEENLSQRRKGAKTQRNSTQRQSIKKFCNYNLL